MEGKCHCGAMVARDLAKVAIAPFNQLFHAMNMMDAIRKSSTQISTVQAV